MNTPLLAMLGLALSVVAGSAAPAVPSDYYVYFGTYTNGAGKGIYRARLEGASGRLSELQLAVEARDPAFLAVHPNGKFLYAIDERADPRRDAAPAGISAYAVEPATGRLTLLNRESAGAAGPCHLAVDHSGRSVLVANYAGGGSAALPIRADGSVGAPASVVPHAGRSVNAARQTAPHAHEIVVSPDNRFALVPDLGIDRVVVYRLDAAKASLAPQPAGDALLPAGSGPRHLAFHPAGRFVYVINELFCTMAAYRWEADAGALREVGIVSTLPAGTKVEPGYSTAEVVAHPSGKFLFGSNRGHNTIVTFAVDPANGWLTPVAHASTQGKTPRHFAVDPAGRWLLAENQDSGTVVVFAIDPATGRLTPTGQTLELPAPVCAVFVPLK
jgi:6-phosphogluconolactonase